MDKKEFFTRVALKIAKPLKKPEPYRRPGSDTSHIPSNGDGVGHATVKARQEYTGDNMIGIGQLHKSNAIPVFRQEDAVALSKMRR